MDQKKIKGYIFDVDGTLYSQKKMRIKMLGRLLSFYCLRPHRLWEFYALYLFRKLREKDKWKRASFEALYLEIGKRIFRPVKKIEDTVQYWMFQAPLDILRSCVYQDVVLFIHKQHAEGKLIIVYSDYPAEEKLHAMEMVYDHVFSFEQNEINEQKPSRIIMNRILATSGFEPEQLLYVGDREDRDRVSAEMVHIPYCDIAQFRRSI